MDARDSSPLSLDGQTQDENGLTEDLEVDPHAALTNEECRLIQWNVGLMEPLCSIQELRYYSYAYEDAARRKEQGAS